MRLSGLFGQPNRPLPSLGVSSLDLGRSSHRAAPSLCPAANLLSPPAAEGPAAAMRPQGFCNAKKFPCVLCAAHLGLAHEAGDFVAGFVALLGRFLPRLGPHGSPRGPFYFGAGIGVGSAVLRCNITRWEFTPRRHAFRGAPARRQTPCWPGPPVCASAWRNRLFS
jgi:hypothetical protein